MKSVLWETLRVKEGNFTEVNNRAAVKEHIPKKSADLENPIVHSKAFDNTHDRIHGERKPETFDTINQFYGASKNPVDDMPKVGQREMHKEAEVTGYRNCR